MNLHEISHLAQTIAREAGALLRHGLGQPQTIERKSTAIDWVTAYDKASEAHILQRLQTAFPDHGFYAEESGHHAGDSDYVWYIDPLDGTVNFAHSVPFFSVSIALYANGRPLLGTIYDPARDECFSAITGQGGFVTQGSHRHRCRVSQTAVLQDCLLTTGFATDRHQTQQDNIPQTAALLAQAQDIRRTGSAALDLAYVAAGRFDGYWELRLSPWDVAAGVLLVQEAGGQATLLDGSPFRMQPEIALVASNGRIHQQTINILMTAP